MPDESIFTKTPNEAYRDQVLIDGWVYSESENNEVLGRVTNDWTGEIYDSDFDFARWSVFDSRGALENHHRFLMGLNLNVSGFWWMNRFETYWMPPNSGSPDVTIDHVTYANNLIVVPVSVHRVLGEDSGTGSSFPVDRREIADFIDNRDGMSTDFGPPGSAALINCPTGETTSSECRVENR